VSAETTRRRPIDRGQMGGKDEWIDYRARLIATIPFVRVLRGKIDRLARRETRP
jgi:hypothetical protein